MEIPVYRLPYSEEDIRCILGDIEKALRKGYLTDGGELVKSLEEKFSRFLGARHAVAVNSATTALETILRAISIQGGSVVVPSYTFIATPMAVANVGGRPVYADIEKETLSLSVRTIQAAVRDDTKAVIIVHVGGILTPEIEEIRAYCDKRGIALVEDCACSVGSTAHGKHSGVFGHASAFSFHHSKILTTGEGGMVVTADDGIAEKSLRIRAIGLNRAINNWQAFTQGSNFKMCEPVAALGIRHVDIASAIIAERQRIAEFYDKEIRYDDNVMRFLVPKGTTSSYYKYLIRVREPAMKSVIRERLAKKGVMLPPNLYDNLCHTQEINAEIGAYNAFGSLPNSEYMRDHHFCLNMYNGMRPEELRYVVDSLNEIIRSL